MITLDQARALDALARHGTYARAAKALRRQHTAVLYAVKQVEALTGITVLDREGYRTRFTPQGEEVLAWCRKLLAMEAAFAARCDEMRMGWEPRLGIVFDAVVPSGPVLRAVGELARAGCPTRITVSAEFLSGVEAAFVRGDADLMVSVLPPTELSLQGIPMAPITSRLVAHKDHPLAQLARVTEDDLRAHVLLVVHGSDPRLQLPTAGVEVPSTVSLHDFHAKKSAIAEGIGYGWLPEHLVARELDRGTMVPLRYKNAKAHVFRPQVYHRREVPPGRAARAVLDALRAV